MNMLSMRLIHAPHMYFGTYSITSLSPTLFIVQVPELYAFQNSSHKKKNIFLCPDKHFLTAGLVNSSYYFCVLCYKQCRWPSLVILLHQSSFRFVCFCLDLFSIKGLIDVFFLFPSWVKETKHYNELSKELNVL